MKKVGLTQRAHAVQGYGETRDMLDQRWAELVERLGACPVPLANGVHAVEEYLEALNLDALLFTGGNDIAALPGASEGSRARDRFEARALEHFRRAGRPVLGVCRGAQMINHLSGGRVVRCSGHVGCRHPLVWSPDTPAFWARPPEVNSFHGWAIPADGLAPGLEALAWSLDGTVEAYRSTRAPVVGVLWHPEREAALDSAELAFLAAALAL